MEAKENVPLEEGSVRLFPGMAEAGDRLHNCSLSASCFLPILPPPLLPCAQTQPLRSNIHLADLLLDREMSLKHPPFFLCRPLSS